MFKFVLLGEFRVRNGERDLTPGPAKLRALIAALLARPNTAVSTDVLVDVLWSQNPPRTAAGTLQSYVYRVRRLLETCADASPAPSLAKTPEGYLLQVESDSVDLAMFLGRGRRARVALDVDDPEGALELARSALDLWGGRPFGGVTAHERFRVVEAELEEERVRYSLVAAEARMRRGDHAGTVESLRGMVRDYPLHEELHTLLIEALGRSGQRSEAMYTFHRLRRAMAVDLGMDPSPELQGLYSSFLRDPGPLRADPRARHPGARGARLPVPAQLPGDIDDFRGRTDELHAAERTLRRAPAHAVRLIHVIGMPGVGKSAFAVRLAHRVRTHFPDGQLVAELRRTVTKTGERPAKNPIEILGGFLRSVGFAPRTIPEDLEERAALFRSWCSSRRVLVVLDGAVSAAQVRPLLPGAAECAVVLTSRRPVAGLPEAYEVELGPLASSEVYTQHYAPTLLG